MATKYCIDSSSIIDMWNTNGKYSKEVFVSLWDKFNEYLGNGTIVSSLEVYNELVKEESNKSEFNQWLTANKHCFLDIDEDQIDKLSSILDSFPLLAEGFKGAADPVLVGLALSKGLSIITHEVGRAADQPSSKTPKIPHLCRNFDVACFDIISFCKEEGIKFT